MHLLPITGDDPSLILCQLYHVPIDNMPPYDALSYSWDTDLSGQTPHPTIYVDGKELKITAMIMIQIFHSGLTLFALIRMT
jgi:hypothetical protein